MKSEFLNFYEEEIQPEIEEIEESLEEAKKFSKKLKKIYFKVFITSIGLYFISNLFETSLFAVLMFVSIILIIVSACFGVFHSLLNTYLISRIRKSYDNEYYSDILPSILYKFSQNFRKSSKVTFPEELYRGLHIEKPYKRYSSSKCIIGNIQGCKTHIAKIRTKGGFSKTQSIIFKVALSHSLKEKTFLISSRHHKKTKRNLPKKNFNLGNEFNKRICIYTKKRDISESCLSDPTFRRNIIELHDLLEGNVSVYVVNNNIYFKLNLDKNIFSRNFFKIVDAEHFAKYDDALEKIQELIVGLNYM